MLNAIGHPGCLFLHQSPTSAARDCPYQATHAGLVVFGEGTEKYRVYKASACADHVVLHSGTIIAAHPMRDRDRAELERRREARRRVLEQHAPAESCYLAPLAVGEEARQLVEQAKSLGHPPAERPVERAVGAGRRELIPPKPARAAP